MPRGQGLRPRGWRRDRPPGPAAVAAGTVTRTRPAVAGLPGRAPDARPFRPRARVRRRGPVGLPAPDVPPQPPCAVVVRAVAVRGRAGGPRGGWAVAMALGTFSRPGREGGTGAGEGAARGGLGATRMI